MAIERRDVLKMMAAAPMFGMFGSGTAEASSGRPHFKTQTLAANDKIIWREFVEPFLPQIAFPLGGIGTGNVFLGGRGDLRDWEIANSSDKGRRLANTFFAIWHKDESGNGRARILESQIAPPFLGWMGYSRDGMPGMPRFKNGRFLGAYPFARLELSDPAVPLEVTLEAFNPFIPLNDKDSGLPLAVFYWRVKNTGSFATPVTVLCSMLNIAGDKSFGKNLNEFQDDGVIRGMKMSCAKHEADTPNFSNLTLATTHKQTTHLTRWARSGWFDDQSLFWDDFTKDGKLDRSFEEGLTADNQTDTCSLGLMDSLQPGESKVFPFLLSWYFPNRQNKWNGEGEVKGQILKNYYATQFEGSWEVARYAADNLRRLEDETRMFQQALFASSLPPAVLDAVSSQASIMRTNVGFRTEDGKFYGFEGTTDDNGCCPLNCAHVWNYEQALAHLFPQLERTMREVDFLHNTLSEGNMAFRTLVPLGDYYWRADLPAADGQMGTIVKLYREWKLSGDTEFLRALWPKAKLALEYAWKRWDKDKDGVMEGVQHNTYDIEFYGPNPFMGAIYLCALRAGEEMARHLGDEAAANDYRAVYESGRNKLDAELWHGDFYVQKYAGKRPFEEMKYQLGPGCLSDQLLGQWMSHVVGLGYVLPPERVRTTMNSIFKNNWKPVFEEHYNPQRIYALGDEAGLLVCSWPKGGRPGLPFPYSDEVWTGIEYHVAAHLIYEGMIEEGIKIVEGARNRYDGQRRNPWDEIECGHHYSRAMSSWSLLLALSGFHFDGIAKTIAFHPVIHPERFQCFWSCGTGWGVYRQQLFGSRLTASIEVLWGGIELNSVRFPKPTDAKQGIPREIHASLAGKLIPAKAEIKDDAVLVSLSPIVNISRDRKLTVNISA